MDEIADNEAPDYEAIAAGLAEIAAEVSVCTACELHKGRTRAVPGEGPVNAEIFFIGEAPGRTEDQTGRPFVGQAGQMLEQWIEKIGLTRDDVFIGNVVKCFISPRVLIYTADGYKPIKDIQLGDLVLTHTGKFRPVTYIRPYEMLPEGSDVVEIIVRPSDDYHKRTVRLTVTPEHPFMIDGQWVRAAEIKAGDAIRVLGDQCEVCGKPFYVHYSRYDVRTIRTCSVTCHNRRIMHSPEVRDKVRQVLKQQYAEGLRDPIAITARANARTRELVAMGHAKVQHFTSEERQLGRIALAQNIMLGEGKHPVGYGEYELLRILDQMEVNYVHHFALPESPYTFDVGLPDQKILIEVRGPGFVNRDSRARARVKDELASNYGYLVVNLWWEQIIHQPQMIQAVLERLLKNHRDAYVYVDVVVESATTRQTRRSFPLYNIGVEGDESYVAAGIVSHNCRPPGNRDPRPEEIAACAGYLERQIALIQPKAIATLGRFSMEKFFPGAKITQVHGKAQRQGNRVVIPLYHPAYVLRNMRALPEAIRDIQRIPRLLERLEQVLREEAERGVAPAPDTQPEGASPEQLSLL